MEDLCGATICGHLRTGRSLGWGKIVTLPKTHYFEIVSLLEIRRKSLVPWEVLTIGLCAQVACLLACTHWLHKFEA